MVPGGETTKRKGVSAGWGGSFKWGIWRMVPAGKTTKRKGVSAGWGGSFKRGIWRIVPACETTKRKGWECWLRTLFYRLFFNFNMTRLEKFSGKIIKYFLQRIKLHSKLYTLCTCSMHYAPSLHVLWIKLNVCHRIIKWQNRKLRWIYRLHLKVALPRWRMS